jgi:hypothetical protein
VQTVTATASQTTTSTSVTDMSNGSVNITTTGGPVLVCTAGTISNNTATQFTAVSVDRDGNNLGEHGVGTSATAGAFVPFSFTIVDTPGSGAHTYKLRWRVGGNTGTLNSGVLSVIELKK